MRLSSGWPALLALCATASCSKLGGQSADGGGGADGGGAASASLAFLSGFEGEVDGFTKDAKSGQVPIALLIKAAKVRFEVPEHVMRGAAGNPFGEKAYVIFDAGAKKLSIVSDAQKQAIVVDVSTSAKTLSGFGGLGGGPHPPGAPQQPSTKITKTGKYDTVAGYKCENWDVSSDHREATICVSDDGPSWLSIPSAGIPTDRGWVLELLDGKHFPLRMVSYAKDGATEESRIEVTKIDKKPEADAQFQVPAGYKTIDLEKMMTGFGIPGGFPGPKPPPPGR